MALYHSPLVVTDGLVLYLDAANSKSYPGSGTTWTDLSGGSRVGTFTNGPTYSSSNGGNIVFDGTDDYVSVSSPAGLNPGTGSFTVEYWCKIAPSLSDSGASCALEARGDNLNGILCIAFYPGAYMSLFVNGTQDGSQNVYTSTVNPVQKNTWNYQAMMVDRTTQQITFYYNGLQTGNKVNLTDTGSVDPGGGYRYWVGGDLGGSPMEGSIACLKQYNRALTAAEVSQNFNALRTRFGI